MGGLLYSFGVQLNLQCLQNLGVQDSIEMNKDVWYFEFIHKKGLVMIICTMK